MNAQQLHDHIIKPTLEYMGGNYNTPEARLLLLGTAAIESDCGYYIKQVNGPALGIWQPEPATHDDIWENCDALSFDGGDIAMLLYSLAPLGKCGDMALIASPMYCCAIARLKYSMEDSPLPKITGNRKHDEVEFYNYYVNYYHGDSIPGDEVGEELGKSTFSKWQIACEKHNIFEVEL